MSEIALLIASGGKAVGAKLIEHYVLSIATILAGAIYLSGATVWTESISPRIDRYLMLKIDEYVQGGLQTRVARFDPSLEKSEKGFAEYKKRIFDDVDSVYPIYLSFKASDLAAGNRRIFYIYADPAKHRVQLILNTRLRPFFFTVYINSVKYTSKAGATNVPSINEDVTDFIKLHPLQASTGGYVSESEVAGAEQDTFAGTAYAPDTAIVQIAPSPSNFSPAHKESEDPFLADVQGYVVVSKAMFVEAKDD